GGDFAEGCDLRGVFGFTAAGQPQQWPLRLGKAHWCALLPPQTPGRCLLRCRTIDANGAGQPLPRPFRKSGRCDIEEREFTVAEA
ncbi:MAG: hypothetical protein ACKPJJ_22775, partial [Planctomycetaceae bacterium]